MSIVAEWSPISAGIVMSRTVLHLVIGTGTDWTAGIKVGTGSIDAFMQNWTV